MDSAVEGFEYVLGDRKKLEGGWMHLERNKGYSPGRSQKGGHVKD
jgi:hypothetical protein